MELGKDYRGPGFYLNWIKILACWLVFLCWVYTTDWLSTDCVELKKMNYLRWNPIVVGTFMAAFVLVWLIPYFWVGFPLLVAAYVAPLATYVVYRNAEVGDDEKVLTREHLRYWVSVQLAKVGVKIAGARVDPEAAGLVAKLTGEGGPDERTNTARTIMARQSPGLRGAGYRHGRAGQPCRGDHARLRPAERGDTHVDRRHVDSPRAQTA